MTTTRAHLEPSLSEASAGQVRATSKGLGISPMSVRAIVRPLMHDDERVFTALAAESFEFHRKWIKLPTESEAFKRYLARFDSDDAFFFVICDVYSKSIVGFVSLTGIEREPYQRGRLGYGIFEPYARAGYISAGLNLVLKFAFEELKLHRLEADIQPKNIPSKRLAAKIGFTCEGVSRGFIRINSEWIDHERWVATSDE